MMPEMPTFEDMLEKWVEDTLFKPEGMAGPDAVIMWQRSRICSMATRELKAGIEVTEVILRSAIDAVRQAKNFNLEMYPFGEGV